MRNRERGFTLIELLIVLAILGILVGIVAMSVGNIRENALKRGMQSEWEVVNTAVESYCALEPSSSADYPGAIGTYTDDDASGGFDPDADTVTAAAKVDPSIHTEVGTYLDRATKYYYVMESACTSDVILCVYDAAAEADASWHYCTGDTEVTAP